MRGHEKTPPRWAPRWGAVEVGKDDARMSAGPCLGSVVPEVLILAPPSAALASAAAGPFAAAAAAEAAAA